MNGQEINNCLTILKKLLIPNKTLSSSEKQVLLNFFIKEHIKSIYIYEAKDLKEANNIFQRIADRKKLLIDNQQYESLARLRDLEKLFQNVVEIIDELKRHNLKVTFSYGLDGFRLIIIDGEYKHAVEEIKRLGLQLIFFSKALEKIKI